MIRAMYDNQQKGYFEDELEQKARISSILTGVFLWMFLGLLVSAGVAWLSVTNETLWNFIYETAYGFYAIIFLQLAIVLFGFPMVWKMSGIAGGLVFFLYSAVNGMTLSVIFLTYDLGTIAYAFIASAAMFGVMAVYGAVTKSDLSSYRGLLLMGLFGVIIASVINIFLGSGMLDVIICLVAIAVFVGLTAYDVQRIKAMAIESDDPSTDRRIMIQGALSLYLNFINIFLRLLRLLGRRK